MVKDKKINILVVGIVGRNPNNDQLYSYLGKICNVHNIKLTKIQAKKFYNNIDFQDSGRYDRVLIDIPFKLIFPHKAKLRKITKLVFYEEDSCQNYIKKSRWYGKFAKFYASIPSARALTTSQFVTERFKDKGIDAIFIGKAFDSSVIMNSVKPRNIKFAFVGRVKSKVYSERKILLDEISKFIPLKLLRSEPGSAYNRLLNQITYFISADVGLGEYMIKNFEALGAGCLLCTYRIPTELAVLGFKDMENVVLYSSPEELVEKIDFIEKNLELKEKIIKNGLLLAKNYTYENQAKKLLCALSAKCLIPKKNTSMYRKFINRIWCKK